jgi:hypothetical protein
MGTTSKRWTICTHKEFKGDYVKEFILEEYYDIEIAMIHFVPQNNYKHEVYTIMRNKKGVIFICLILVEIENNEIFFKEIEESMGPNYYNCAKELFKYVPVAPNEYALEWRKTCEQNNVKLNKINL